MKRYELFIFFLSLLLFSASLRVYSQNSMGIGTQTPNQNAVLELISPTNDQGFLVPRYTTSERTSTVFTSKLSNTDNGLMIFDSDEGQFYFWFSGAWQQVTNVSSGGDMTRLVYDTNDDGVVDSSANAGSINGLTVETAVPALAVFTDEQTAGEVDVTPSGNLLATDVQGALDELQTELDSQVPSPWTVTGGDLTYSSGKVGLFTSNLLSDFQVGNKIHVFNFSNSDFDIANIGMLGYNIHPDETDPINEELAVTENGSSGLIIFNDDGDIEFLHGDSVMAGTTLLQSGLLNTSLSLRKSRDAEFRGAVEIGELRDSTNFSSGTISYGNGGFYGFNGVSWERFGGISFPSENFIDESGGTPFYIQNNGTGGLARFELSNTGASGNSLEIQNNADNTLSRGLVLHHDGLGPAAEFNINEINNTQNVISAITVGEGHAGRFEVDNMSNNTGALYGEVVNGTGKAIEGYMRGLGQAARFTVDNASNGSIAFSVNSNGTNSTAYFSNTNSGASTATVEISNNGTGAGLTIQNPGGTTSFGDVSFINGDLGIGQFNPSAKLDVVGNTELNGNVTTTGSLDVGGDVTTSAAVYSNVRQITSGTAYTIAANDHIVEISANADVVITLPDPALMTGRELIILTRSPSPGNVHAVRLNNTSTDSFFTEGSVETGDINMSISAGDKTMVTLRAVGTYWHVINFIESTNI